MAAITFPLIRSQQYGMVVAPPIFAIFSMGAVVLRFTARRRAQRRPDSSDYTLLVALVLSIAYSGLNMAECLVGGGGLHVSEIFALGGSMVPFQKVSFNSWRASLCSSTLISAKVLTHRCADWLSCASPMVNYCDFREDIHPFALLQDLYPHMVHMVRTLHRLAVHQLHDRDYPRRLSCLSAVAILLGHIHSRRSLRQ